MAVRFGKLYREPLVLSQIHPTGQISRAVCTPLLPARENVILGLEDQLALGETLPDIEGSKQL